MDQQRLHDNARTFSRGFGVNRLSNNRAMKYMLRMQFNALFMHFYWYVVSN